MYNKRNKRKINVLSIIILLLALSSFQESKKIEGRYSNNINLYNFNFEEINKLPNVANTKREANYHIKTSAEGISAHFEVPISGKINESTQIFGDLTTY